MLFLYETMNLQIFIINNQKRIISFINYIITKLNIKVAVYIVINIAI